MQTHTVNALSLAMRYRRLVSSLSFAGTQNVARAYVIQQPDKV